MVRTGLVTRLATLALLLVGCWSFSLPDRCSRFPGVNRRFLQQSGLGASGDERFQLRVRRASDGVMVEGWFEPNQEYLVTLTNSLPMINFNDFLFWLTPSEPPTSTSDMKVGLLLVKLKRNPRGHNWITFKGGF